MIKIFVTGGTFDKDYDEKNDTWEPVENILDPVLIKKYRDSLATPIKDPII